MVNMATEEDVILSNAWAQLATLGYTQDGKNRDSTTTLVSSINSTTCLDRDEQCFVDRNLQDRYHNISPNKGSSPKIDNTLRERMQRFSQKENESLTKRSNHALLAHLAAQHLSVSEFGPFDETNINETRSSFSSPGKVNVTIRERLGKMSRKERRDLLLKGVSTEDNPSNSTEDYQSIDGHGSGITEPQFTFDLDGDDSYTRLKRQMNYGPRRQESDSNIKHNPQSTRSAEASNKRAMSSVSKRVMTPRTTNRVALHVYDLFSNDTLMQLPFGCVCHIGKCFTEVNTALLSIGTGVYHVGVEVNGIEYAYGATSTRDKTGIFSCIPRMSPGYQYRTTIEFGEIPLMRRSWVSVPNDSPPRDKTNTSTIVTQRVASSFRLHEEFVDGRVIIKEMVNEYMGIDYDLLRKNCCTFAHDACRRLGVAEDSIPSWFRNLAETGAMTQDMANATIVHPLNKVLSGCDITNSESSLFDRPMSPAVCESGFEIIARRNASNTKDIVIVVDAKPSNAMDDSRTGFVRTPTWAY